MDAADKDFAKTAAAMKLTIATPVTVKEMEESFGPLGNQRNIVRWAFESGTEVGAIKRFEVANLGHVIAKLQKVNDEGLMAVDVVRSFIEPILKNKKKAELIKAKMAGSSLEAISKAVASPVQQAVDVTLENPVLNGGVGQEPKVVGNAFALATGKLSAPIEGNTGVYVVLNKSTVKAPVLKNHSAYVAKLKAQSAGDVNRVIPALKANAKIEDNRSQFNY
jgi:peptidyl-prolyl cis-trans isomerase D